MDLVPHSHGPTNPGQTQAPPRLMRSHVPTNPGYEVQAKNGIAEDVEQLWSAGFVRYLCMPMLQFRQLLGVVWNMTVFNKIADELARKGYQRDTKQCWEKLKQLKKKYNKASSMKVCFLGFTQTICTAVVTLAK